MKRQSQAHFHRFRRTSTLPSKFRSMHYSSVTHRWSCNGLKSISILDTAPLSLKSAPIASQTRSTASGSCTVPSAAQSNCGLMRISRSRLMKPSRLPNRSLREALPISKSHCNRRNVSVSFMQKQEFIPRSTKLSGKSLNCSPQFQKHPLLP